MENSLRQMPPHPPAGSPIRATAIAAGLTAMVLAGPAPAADLPPSSWSDSPVLSEGFPFQGVSLDLGEAGGSDGRSGIVPRGVVLPLGESAFACFDIDLLRMAGAWVGDGMEFASISTISYQNPKAKAAAGQSTLTRPLGEMVVATPALPGIHPSAAAADDPRPVGPDPGEAGRGPLPESIAEWRGIVRSGNRALLRYRCGGAEVLEMPWAQRTGPGAKPTVAIGRSFQLGPHPTPVFVLAAGSAGEPRLLGERTALTVGAGGTAATRLALAGDAAALIAGPDGRSLWIALAPSGSVRTIHLLAWSDASGTDGASPDEIAARAATIPLPDFPEAPYAADPLWNAVVTTPVQTASAPGAGYVVESIGLPQPNPWNRRVRPSALDFFDDGRAVVATIDGDVWTVAWTSREGEELAVWRRIAAGLHEPQGIATRGDEILVFSRNGIESLRDTNADHEIDEYEAFCHRFTQSAETRDYALDMVRRPDGGFYIVKGGQQTELRTPHSGRILAVSPDGRNVRVHADGLRNAFLGIHPETGLLTASDQQGHWIPSTPIHIVREGGYYGFQLAAPVDGPEPPVDPPWSWIPHRAAQSATGQVWLTDRRSGPLSGSLVLLDYFRPGLLKVYADPEGRARSGAVVPLPLEIPVPVLKARVNPADGLPYFAGFQIWGTASGTMEGLFRLRWTGGVDPLPRAVTYGRQGIVLEFGAPLDAASVGDPAAFLVQRWNYQRSAEYGSGHFLRNGSPGQEIVSVAGAHLSDDRRCVFIHVPHMTEVMQMSVRYDVALAADRTRLANEAYFSVTSLDELDLAGLGFPAIDLEWEAREAVLSRRAEASAAASIDRGRLLHASMGCVACHSVDGSTEGKSGPTWAGLFGSERPLEKGEPVKATDDYLRESILDPAAKVVKGFNPKDVGMPSYRGILSDEDLESIILYIRSIGPG